MVDYIVTDPCLHINVPKFQSYIEAKSRSNPIYAEVRARRISIKYKYKNYSFKLLNLNVNRKNQIKSGLLAASGQFDHDYNYSPPSEIDEIIAEYFYESNMNQTIYPAAKMIASGDTNSAVMTITSIVQEFCKTMNITNETSYTIVYTSIVRLLFDQSYVIESELNKYRKEDEIFLKKAEEFSQRSIREMRLSKDIQRYYTPGLKLGSLFTQKQFEMLKQLEFITNPIDLAKHIHSMTLTLANFFGSETGVLSFDDTLTLILSLTAKAPPANTVSITKFLEKWSKISLDKIVDQSKDFFIAAVQQLLYEEDDNNPDRQ